MRLLSPIIGRQGLEGRLVSLSQQASEQRGDEPEMENTKDTSSVSKRERGKPNNFQFRCHKAIKELLILNLYH